jgi:hypothetical protein
MKEQETRTVLFRARSLPVPGTCTCTRVQVLVLVVVLVLGYWRTVQVQGTRSWFHGSLILLWRFSLAPRKSIFLDRGNVVLVLVL